METTKKNKNAATVVVLLLCVAALAIAPLFLKKGAEFGGSDDAGSVMVEEVTGEAYTPWFTPILENMLGGEIPGEVESLVFCIQTGIGVGIIAFIMGRLVERKKQEEMRR